VAAGAQSNKQAAKAVLILFKGKIQVNFIRIETSEFSINY